MPRGTRLRNLRVSDRLWNRAKQVAARRGDTLADVLRDSLAAYLMQGDASRMEGERATCALCSSEVVWHFDEGCADFGMWYGKDSDSECCEAFEDSYHFVE